MSEGGTMSKWHGGKGSGRRTTANNAAYDEGFERIFGKKKPDIKVRKQTPSHGSTKVHVDKKKKANKERARKPGAGSMYFHWKRDEI